MVIIEDLWQSKTEIKIGSFVKLSDLRGTPLPKLMRNSIQKVVATRCRDGISEVRVERQHRRRLVQCWIPVILVSQTLSSEEAFPACACIRHAPHKRGSGDESNYRQRYLPCSEKDQCCYYQTINGRTSI